MPPDHVVATRRLDVVDLGTVDYQVGLDAQQQLVAARQADQISDTLILAEYHPVYTLGRRADPTNVLGTRDIAVVRTDRGGDVTYHGPGQLVAYPIVRLTRAREVRAYIGALEAACVDVAADFGVAAMAATDAPPGAPGYRRSGVWVGADKLVAIGVRVQQGVTSHGLGFNVCPDLDAFRGIVACGLTDAGACSLASLGATATVDEVGTRLAVALSRRLATAA